VSHIEDLWFKEVPDPDRPGKTMRVPKPDHGKGMRYKVRWTPPGEKEKSKSFPDKQKSAASAFKTSIDNSMLERRYVDPKIGKTPFKTVAYEWLKGTSPDPQSRHTYTRQMELHLFPFFEGMSIERAASASAVRDWGEWLGGRGLEVGYHVVLYQQVSSILRFAVSARYVSENPFEARAVNRPKVPRKLVVPWDREKVDAIYAALPDRYKIVIPLGIGLGLRQGEILGLDVVADLNRRDRVLHVRRQLRRLPSQELVFRLPKGNKTRRVPVSDWVLKQIDAHVERFPAQAVALPWRVPSGRVEVVDVLVSRPDRKYWYGELFNATVWKGAFREAGLVRRPREDGMHQLRHFYASTQLAGGVSVRELADYLGHADASLTLNTYTHLIPSSHGRSRLAVDEAFADFDPDTAQGRPDGSGDGAADEAAGGVGIVDLDE